MKKNEGVNRRQFLVSTSVATVGAAALSGKQLAAETVPQTFRSKSGSVIPYSRQVLFSDRNSQRTFIGRESGEVAFPLGGIGTGTVSLGGRGELRDWEIFNRPAKRRVLPFSFVALWARPEGGILGPCEWLKARCSRLSWAGTDSNGNPLKGFRIFRRRVHGHLSHC